jgi:hypothetical protein
MVPGVHGSVVIEHRFRGPPDSGNGGYSCGLVAREIDGPAEVTLRVPPPLERELALERDGERVVMRDGETLVAEAAPSSPRPAGDPPPPVALDAARAAVEGSTFLGDRHPFPTCFVCGPKRSAGDGLRIFPARVDGGDLFAAAWTPDTADAGPEGTVPTEIVWSALDCPTSAPLWNEDAPEDELKPIVLARLAVDIEAPVRAGEPHVITSWPIAIDGRKRHAGAALFTADGELLASARALWIELKQT